MTEKEKPSTPYGEPDKDMEKTPNPKTGEASAPYGEEGGTETTEPAKKAPLK